LKAQLALTVVVSAVIGEVLFLAWFAFVAPMIEIEDRG
jgi:hypothetical protein